MRLYSTKNKQVDASLREAILKGMPEDGGLYMPQTVPKMPDTFFQKIYDLDFQEIAFTVVRTLISDDLPSEVLSSLVNESINFDAPVVPITNRISTLELFHGPTLAFKDFGARFMARLFSYFTSDSEEALTILVATSGDTGSAVAHGFYQVPGIRVVILYPKNKVSRIQEQQFTTLGANITALEIDGVFDDCQRLVKTAFVDPKLVQHLRLTSANSINIARLIPQSFYYFNAFAHRRHRNKPLVISVPSGNYGNLTAGLLAKKMGLPVQQFIAAANRNDVVPDYLQTGNFNPRPSIETISNAMDVGNPSNFARILELYDCNWSAIRNDIYGASYTDGETRSAIQQVDAEYGYTMDPHGAVGYLALKNYVKTLDNNAEGIFLETAHPAKFLETVQPLLSHEIKIPKRLQASLEKDKKSIPLQASLKELREFLLDADY